MATENTLRAFDEGDGKKAYKWTQNLVEYLTALKELAGDLIIGKYQLIRSRMSIY